MKSFAVAALVATVASQSAPKQPTYGEGCKADPLSCDATGETCVQWFDSEDYPRTTCQDCTGTSRTIIDEYSMEITFFCPGEESEEAATSLYASAAALAAAVAMMY